jgi:arylsulfatase A-like enzyme
MFHSKNLLKGLSFLGLLSLINSCDLAGKRNHSQGKQDQNRNILFIIVDDLRPELGCYGSEHMHTPNIDELANSGIVFKRAYVQQAVCSASRASFLTGCRPDQTGVDYPYSDYFVQKFTRDYPTLQNLYFNAGYHTVTAGKVHHGGPGDKVGEDISVPHIESEGPKFYALEENIQKGGERGRSNETPAWECADVEDDAYRDGAITEELLSHIKNAVKLDMPFLLIAGYYKPHLPFAAPKKYFDLYNKDSIRLSLNPIKPENTEEYSILTAELPTYEGGYGYDSSPVPDSIARILRHAYFACVSYIDAQIGKLIAELKSIGQYENTIIVLIGDHGFHLGDQGMWGKHTNFERATWSPLIISAPGIIEAGIHSNALVEYVDIYPTLVEMTGLSIKNEVEGTSLVPLFENPTRAWKKAAFSQYPREDGLEGFSIRTDRYRYVEWRYKDGKVDSRELYDHEIDSFESINFAENIEYEEIVESLSVLLNSEWKNCLPPGIENYSNIPTAPEAVEWKENE